MVSRHTTDSAYLGPVDGYMRAADGSSIENNRQLRPDRTMALQIVITLAGFFLLAAIWLAVLVSVDTEQRDAKLRAEGTATNLAFAAEWQLNRQLLATDQILQSLAAEWAADPVRFEANGWRKRVAVPDDLTLQIFLLDARGSVVSATRSELMGLDMSQLEHYTAQRSGRGKALFVGPAIRWKTSGRWEINLSRRLQREDGSFAGAIVATYDP